MLLVPGWIRKNIVAVDISTNEVEGDFWLGGGMSKWCYFGVQYHPSLHFYPVCGCDFGMYVREDLASCLHAKEKVKVAQTGNDVSHLAQPKSEDTFVLQFVWVVLVLFCLLTPGWLYCLVAVCFVRVNWCHKI